LSQGKYTDALKFYDGVLAVRAKGRLADQQAQEATIGRTYCLVGTNRAQEALKILQDSVAKADDDDTALLAREYCALGNCYRALGDHQQALWAYLRVDLLYANVPEADAEALANLEVLWNEMHRPDRARDAHESLISHYPNSRWSKRGMAR
jgi:tetratricopeptide (TPR) repeat protein